MANKPVRIAGSLLVLAVLLPAMARAMDVVVDGKAVTSIVVAPNIADAPTKPDYRRPTDMTAATVLAEWIEKMTGAKPVIVRQAPANGKAIYVGAAAVAAGLKIDDIDSPSHEGLRVVSSADRILLAGQNGTSTVKAACRLLEEMGCRFLMDMPMGEVYPSTQTLRTADCDIKEKPLFVHRRIWGSSWAQPTLWKVWNGNGGEPLGVSHAWGSFIPKGTFEHHPEWFSLINGQRKDGEWVCTSNPDLRKFFAQQVIDTIKAKGSEALSISPPDGVQYCQCDACKAQDDPTSIEATSNRVNITNRYVDFFNYIAREVAKDYPKVRLSFYCYADYTQAPTRGMKLEPNLVAWVAPIRYCRWHEIGSEVCPSRQQLTELVQDWGKCSAMMGYRTYNFNLAEVITPVPLISVWKHDIPFLAKNNCRAINLETLDAWELYGPHIYLSLKLSYDANANADAILEDFYTKFYGPAAPAMKQYWNDLDRRVATLPTHAGSVFGIHRIYSPDMLEHCGKLIEQARQAAGGEKIYADRVKMTAEGYTNAVQFIAARNALNEGKPAEAQKLYDTLLERARANTKAGFGAQFTEAYLKRFVGKSIAASATAGRVAMVLPDRWQLAYDVDGTGAEKGFGRTDFDDSKWKSVATFSETLDGQGLTDAKTFIWYRTTIDLPASETARTLFFAEIDGLAQVYVNGQLIGAGEKRRVSFALNAASALKPSKNVIAVQVDHRTITELYLGGIIRPVYLVEPK